MEIRRLYISFSIDICIFATTKLAAVLLQNHHSVAFMQMRTPMDDRVAVEWNELMFCLLQRFVMKGVFIVKTVYVEYLSAAFSKNE